MPGRFFLTANIVGTSGRYGGSGGLRGCLDCLRTDRLLWLNGGGNSGKRLFLGDFKILGSGSFVKALRPRRNLGRALVDYGLLTGEFGVDGRFILGLSLFRGGVNLLDGLLNLWR
jgi:hypothetical protein